MDRLALVSFHGCPVARLGERDSGGMNVYVLQVARELARRGHLVDVYTRCHDLDDPQVVDLGYGARVIHLEAGPYDGTKDTLYRYIPEFVGNLHRFTRAEGIGYGLVHSHYWLSGRVGMALRSQWDVPHVTTFHTLARAKMNARAGESESDLRVRVEETIMEEADAIVVSTNQEAQDLARLYGTPGHNVSVVAAGVDVEMFRPTDRYEAQSGLGLTGRRVVLYVGRIEPLKGLDILIGAVACVEDIPDISLVIVGGSPDADGEMERLKALSRELGIADRVVFTGAVSHADIPQYYNAADVFVLPSYHESFGLVALEAMACGTPVVASRVGGLTSFVSDGLTGYLIPWRCPEPFARRIETLLSNPILRDRMGQAARSMAMNMTWTRAAERTVNVYESVTARSVESAVGD